MENLNDLLINEYSLIYNAKGERMQLTFELFKKQCFNSNLIHELLRPEFFLQNVGYLKEINKTTTKAIDGDIIVDHYQNHSGAVYLSFILIVMIASEKLLFYLDEEDYEETIKTVLKLLPEIIYNSKYSNQSTKIKPPVSFLNTYKKLPSKTKDIFFDSSRWFRGVFFGINKSFYLLAKYDPTIRDKQADLLNPMIDGHTFCIAPIFESKVK